MGFLDILATGYLAKRADLAPRVASDLKLGSVSN